MRPAITKFYLPNCPATFVILGTDQLRETRGIHILAEPACGAIRRSLEDALHSIERDGWTTVWLHCDSDDIRNSVEAELERLDREMTLDFSDPLSNERTTS